MRNEINLNPAWKFAYGDYPEAIDPGFSDAEWYDVDLPHSFSIPYDLDESGFYVGYGCYRKRLWMAEGVQEKTVLLEIGAAFQEAEIYLNGRRVGSHRGGTPPLR